MSIEKKRIFSGLFVFLSAAALVVATAQAATRGGVAGYQTDSFGNIMRSGSGDCIHTSSWTPADATIVGCDGVELDAPIEVLIGQGSGVFADITIPAASLFEFDKAELSDDSKAVIDVYKKTLSPELSEAYLVLIVGHTDSSGNARHNDELSLRRAESVAEYLVTSGVPADVIRMIGRGSREPLASNETREGRVENRRVDILAVAEVRALDTMLFPSAALFERRSGSLNAKGQAILERNRMNAQQLLSRASFIEIVGHTDDVGDDDYNMALSEQRARSVRDYLVSKGLDPSKVVTTGMGETMPIASNNTPQGRAENRRVEILLLGRIKE